MPGSNALLPMEGSARSCTGVVAVCSRVPRYLGHGPSNVAWYRRKESNPRRQRWSRCVPSSGRRQIGTVRCVSIRAHGWSRTTASSLSWKRSSGEPRARRWARRSPPVTRLGRLVPTKVWEAARESRRRIRRRAWRRAASNRRAPSRRRARRDRMSNLLNRREQLRVAALVRVRLLGDDQRRDVLDLDEPLLCVAPQRLAAQTELHRASLDRAPARIVVGIPLQPHFRSGDRVSPLRLARPARPVEARRHAGGEDRVEPGALEPHRQDDLLVGLLGPAAAVHHPQEVGLDPAAVAPGSTPRRTRRAAPRGGRCWAGRPGRRRWCRRRTGPGCAGPIQASRPSAACRGQVSTSSWRSLSRAVDAGAVVRLPRAENWRTSE